MSDAMRRRLRFSAAAVLFALSPAFAVEVEGPVGETPTPLPVVAAELAPVAPDADPLKVPIAVDAALAVSLETIAPAVTAANQAAAAPASAQNAAQTPRAAAESRVVEIGAAVTKAADAAGKAEATGERRVGAGVTIEEAISGEKKMPSDYVAVSARGVADGAIKTGPRLEPAGKAGQYRARTGYNVLYGTREEMVNPGHVYAEAYYAASHAAQKMGLSGRVFFAEVTGSLPLKAGEHAKFAFYPSGPQAKRSVIYVDFSRSIATIHGDFDVKTSVFTGVPAPAMKFWPGLDNPAGYPYMDKAFYYGPQTALDAARRASATFGPGASFSARVEKDEKTGDVDVWYHLYDGKGNQVDVNARTLAAKTARSAPPKPARTPWAQVYRDSGPIVSLGLFPYALWFAINFALTRDLFFSLAITAPIGILLAVLIGTEVYDARTRPKK